MGRDISNFDLRTSGNNVRDDERQYQEAVKGQAAAFAAGYETLDRSTIQDEFGTKERADLARNANFPRRY